MNNALKHFTIFYQNIRGIKSKIDLLTETVDDTNPTIMCLVETHMLKEQAITIPGETIFREDTTNSSGGIMIAVKDSIKTINMQIQHEKSIRQALWVQLDNQKISLKVGVIYAPQENITPVRELKKIYESINKEIQEAREHK